MGFNTTHLTSVLSHNTKKPNLSLQSVANPVPFDHIKAKGKQNASDTTYTQYKSSNGFIPRGDISFEGTHHYWPNYYCDTKLYLPSKPAWADTEDTNNICFNTIDNGVDRTSHHGPYKLNPYMFDSSQSKFVFGKFPLNPVGVTGITGRGQLGKWGPNHAADPIMATRRNGAIEFVSIQRTDTGEWALPGGMVELGDNVSITLKKEFGEEAMDTLMMDSGERLKTKQLLDQVFDNAQLVYKGYVDDPRNTDNSWMETVAMLIVVDATVADKFKLSAGDDAGKVRWTKYVPGMKLYASHGKFIKDAISLMGE